MNVSVLRTQLSGVLRRPGRLLMTGLSVLVAAFVVFGTVLAYEIVARTTLDTFSETPTGVSLVVSAQGNDPLSPQQITEIRATAGVVQVSGRSAVTFTVGGASSGNQLEVLSDPGSGPLSRVTLISGAYPSAARQIAVDKRAAGRLGVTAGSRLRLHTGDPTARPVTVTVTGVVDGPRDAVERAWTTDSGLGGISGEEGFQRADVLAAPGSDLQTMATLIVDRLLTDPTVYISVTTGDVMRINEARAAVSQLDKIFALVGMFVAIAVVAAALVATSTFRIVFAQRLRQLALLRTIGAQRGQLVVALAVEGTVVGLVTGTTGVLLAQAAGLAAPALAGAAGRTLSGPGVPIGAAIAVIVGAGLLTLGAVLAPAFSAAGVAPLQALRAASTAAAERGVEPARLAVGLVLTTAAACLGLLTASQFDSGGNEVLLFIVGVGALGFGALIALGPLLIRPVLAVAGWPLRRLGPTGRLAVSGIGGAPRRAAAVTVVVALGVTMLAGTVVGINSLQLWTDREMAARNPADLAMFAEEPGGFDAVVAAVRADPGFRDITPFQMTDFTATEWGLSHEAIAIDMSALPTVRTLETSAGSVTDLAPGKVILSSTAASDLQATVGSAVILQSEGSDGRVPVEVVAVLAGEGPLRAGAMLTPTDLAALGTPVSGLLADIAAGTRDQALASFRAHGAPADVEVAVLADERDKAENEVSSLFAAALGLLGLTVLIAVVGVGTTTGLSVLERTRESGLLRALGLTRARLRLMISMEAGLYGLIGALLGIALGVPMAWLTLSALRLDLPLTFPAGWLAAIVLVIATITVASGLLPARRAARVSPVSALATD